jgi:hypothetical protein
LDASSIANVPLRGTPGKVNGGRDELAYYALGKEKLCVCGLGGRHISSIVAESGATGNLLR